MRYLKNLLLLTFVFFVFSQVANAALYHTQANIRNMYTSKLIVKFDTSGNGKWEKWNKGETSINPEGEISNTFTGNDPIIKDDDGTIIILTADSQGYCIFSVSVGGAFGIGDSIELYNSSGTLEGKCKLDKVKLGRYTISINQ